MEKGLIFKNRVLQCRLQLGQMTNQWTALIPPGTERSRLIWFPSKNLKMEIFINPPFHLLNSFSLWGCSGGWSQSQLPSGNRRHTTSVHTKIWQFNKKYRHKLNVLLTSIPSKSIIRQITSFSWKKEKKSILSLSRQCCSRPKDTFEWIFENEVVCDLVRNSHYYS